MLNGARRQEQKTGYFCSNKKQHKTHCLMLIMKRADKKRNKLMNFLFKNTHKTKDHLV